MKRCTYFNHAIYWTALSLFIKGSILWFYLSFLPSDGDIKFWSFLTPDGHSYINPIERFIRGERYFPDYRMPGLGFFYFIFRLFLSKVFALNTLLVFQTLISSISIYYLSRLAQQLFSSKFAFYSTFFLSAFGLYLAQFDALVLTESLALSFIIFFVYCLFQLYDKRKKEYYYLIFGGVCFVFLVFLKPVYLPLGLLAVFVLFETGKKHKYSIILIAKKSILFFAPLIFTIGLWTYRNYQVHQNFIPLNNCYIHPELESSVKWQWMRLLMACGEKISTNQEKSPKVLWIDQPMDSLIANSKQTQKFELPEDIYTSVFNRNDLIEIAILNQKSKKIDQLEGFEQKKQYEELVALSYKKVNRLIESFKKEKPIYFYVKAPLKLLVKYVRAPFGYYDSETKSPTKRMILIYYYFWYWFVFIFGMIGISIQLIKSRRKGIMLFFVPVFYTLFVFPFILRFSENRYLIPAFPFLIIFASYLIDRLRKKAILHPV